MADILRFPESSGASDNAVILKWLKKEGETFQQGDVLLEFETDKSLIELEASRDGVLLYIKVPAGEIKVGEVIAFVGKVGEELPHTPVNINQGTEVLGKFYGVDIIRLPKLSDMMEFAKILLWKVKEGDYIKEGDAIVELETDKSVIEIESFRTGKVLYRLPDNKVEAKENDILMIVGNENAPIHKILEELEIIS